MFGQAQYPPVFGQPPPQQQHHLGGFGVPQQPGNNHHHQQQEQQGGGGGGGGGFGGFFVDARAPAPTLNFGSSLAAPAPAQPSTFSGGGGSAVTTRKPTFTTAATTWYPKKLDMEEIMKDLVEIHEGSDISFSFSSTIDNDSNNNNNNDDDDGGGDGDDGASSLLLLYAHKGILAHRSPQLYDLIKDATDGETIEIVNIKRSVFKHLLVNVYTGVVPSLYDATKDLSDDEGIEFAKDLLLASDQFGLINLKLSLQSIIIEHRILDTGNVADWLLLADNHNCALLKESCMELITEFTQEVMATPSWSTVEESKTLGFELFKYASSSKNNNNTKGKSSSKNRSDVDESWSVSDLLSTLEFEGLELDGTKKMLIERLKVRYEQWQQQVAAFRAAAEQEQQQAAATAAAGGGGGVTFAANGAAATNNNDGGEAAFF